MDNNPKFNDNGCKDPIAYEAIRNVYKAPDDLASRLINLIKQLTDICGFEIIGRIGIRHKTTGKEYR